MTCPGPGHSTTLPSRPVGIGSAFSSLDPPILGKGESAEGLRSSARPVSRHSRGGGNPGRILLAVWWPCFNPLSPTLWGWQERGIWGHPRPRQRFAAPLGHGGFVNPLAPNSPSPSLSKRDSRELRTQGSRLTVRRGWEPGCGVERVEQLDEGGRRVTDPVGNAQRLSRWWRVAQPGRPASRDRPCCSQPVS